MRSVFDFPRIIRRINPGAPGITSSTAVEVIAQAPGGSACAEAAAGSRRRADSRKGWRIGGAVCSAGGVLASGVTGVFMGEIINLRRARKARVRREAGVVADANRAAFGRTKAERARDAEERARGERVLDGARLDGEES